ncbi:MAG: hypothetical protein II233_01585 [Clostridia bacterium]|nr:hypothetical protein [Clostridia bacterium]
MALLNDETKKLLERYCDSACNLYGIIKLSKLLSIYNSQNEPITEEEFLSFIEEIDLEHKHYDFIGEDEFYEDIDEVPALERDLIAEYFIMDDDMSYHHPC